jgi:molybdopterin-binding protein
MQGRSNFERRAAAGFAILRAEASHISETIMKLSARNQIKGKIAQIQKGQTTAHIRIDIGNGVIITSSITNEAVDELGLKPGDSVTAVIKASDVMVGK